MFYFFSFIVAADEVHYASTFEKFEISFPRKGDQGCRYPEMGKQKSEEHWENFSHRELEGFLQRKFCFIFVNSNVLQQNYKNDDLLVTHFFIQLM